MNMTLVLPPRPSFSTTKRDRSVDFPSTPSTGCSGGAVSVPTDNPPAKHMDLNLRKNGRKESGGGIGWKTVCMMLILHAATLVVFTCCVVLIARWKDFAIVGEDDILVNRRANEPLGIHSFITSAPASYFTDTSLAESGRLISVVITLPMEMADRFPRPDGTINMNPGWIRRLFKIEAVEIRSMSNTTILWLPDGFALSVTPEKVELLSTTSDDSLLVWLPSPPKEDNDFTSDTQDEKVSQYFLASTKWKKDDNEVTSTDRKNFAEPVVSYTPHAHMGRRDEV